MEVEEIVSKLYEIHKSSELFDDSFENVVYKFTLAFDSFFFELLKNSIDSAKRGTQLSPSAIDFDQMRNAYRACVQFAYQDCSSGVFKQSLEANEIERYRKELNETRIFNLIRNLIDRSKLNLFSLSVNDDTLIINQSEGKDIEYDAYSRRFSEWIPGGKVNNDFERQKDLFLRLGTMAKNRVSFESKQIFKPHKSDIQKEMDSLVNYFLHDTNAEVLDIKPTTYSLGQYMLVYCVLSALCVYKLAYFLSINSRDSANISFIYPKERLADDIYEYLDKEIELEVIKDIISDLTYDGKIHKDKVVMFQPLIDAGDYYIASNQLILMGYPIDKIMKVHTIRRTNEKEMTRYHYVLSNDMNQVMHEYLNSGRYPYLYSFPNCKLIIDNQTLSEVDLVLYDVANRMGVLVELKHYDHIVNERDGQSKDSKVNSAIESRLEKDKRVLDNLELFLEQNNIPSDALNFRYTSLIVVNEFMGVITKDDIKVVDESLFYFLIHFNKGNLKKVIDDINEETIIKIIRDMKTTTSLKQSYDYKGIKVEVNYH